MAADGVLKMAECPALGIAEESPQRGTSEDL